MSGEQILLLHSRADRALRSLLENRLEKSGVTIMEWLVLSIISRSPKTGLSMSELAATLGVTLPQVTALMTGVVKKKYVRLKTQPRDRRSRHALLTSKGASVAENAKADIDAVLKDTLSEITADQEKAYLTVLEQIARHNIA
ncbi:MAG: MarR family transcriptional regulator [Candidatus Saccharibacteria bacterium]|nr:MarR family transcriptional regulator [Candidatus Saccharibacteria bacterium]